MKADEVVVCTVLAIGVDPTTPWRSAEQPWNVCVLAMYAVYLRNSRAYFDAEAWWQGSGRAAGITATHSAARIGIAAMCPRNWSLLKSLEKRKAQLSDNLRQSEQAVSEAECDRQLYAQIIPSVERVMDIYAQSTPEEKNRLLKTIISRAEYIKTERNTRGNADRCNFTLNVTPLFPEIKTGAE